LVEMLEIIDELEADNPIEDSARDQDPN